MKEVFKGNDYRLLYNNSCNNENSFIVNTVIKRVIEPTFKDLGDRILIDIHFKYDRQHGDEVKEYVDQISRCAVNGLYIDKGDGPRKFLNGYKFNFKGDGFFKIMLKIRNN